MKKLELKYLEEDDDSKFDDKKFVLKNLFVYNERDGEDFEFNIAFTNYHQSELIRFQGKAISNEYPMVHQVTVKKDFDGITIEFINLITKRVYYKTFIHEFMILWFELKVINPKIEEEGQELGV